MKIILKDGSVREYKESKSIYDIALDISEGLARAATAGEVDGRVEDLPLDGEALRRAVTVPQGRISDCVVTWIGLCQACAGELDLPEEPAGSEAAAF